MKLTIAGLLAVGFVGSALAQSGTLVVDARSNVFGYGVTTPAASGGGGLLAPVINLDPGLGRRMSFSATGGASWGDQWPVSGPDGIFAGPSGGSYSTNLSGVGPISGFSAQRHGHLVGVFVESGDVSGFSAPATMNYPNGASLMAASFSPGLRQVFFIGDGLTATGSGAAQVFNIPNGAVRLALGTADGFNFTGLPAWYDDNTGSYDVQYSAVPEPASMSALLLGVFALVSRRKKR